MSPLNRRFNELYLINFELILEYEHYTTVYGDLNKLKLERNIYFVFLPRNFVKEIISLVWEI